MLLKPQDRAELARALAAASAAATKISSVNLAALGRLIAHTPEDMTATVESGMSLGALQSHLHASAQWLPIDPPAPQTLPIADLLAFNHSGPRRLGYGTIRDYLIGMKVALADGQIIKAGGNVVKNVAGYDLCKLFIGARHSLGIIVEATFKLRPLPETEQLVQAEFSSLEQVWQARRALLESAAEPVLLDAHNVNRRLTLVAGFAGPREDVAYQLGLANRVGLSTPATDNYHPAFWDGADCPSCPSRPLVSKLSVLPTDTLERLAGLGSIPFLAHLGNGIIYYRGGSPPAAPAPSTVLMRRLKNAYDPKNILPECPA